MHFPVKIKQIVEKLLKVLETGSKDPLIVSVVGGGGGGGEPSLVVPVECEE